MIQYVECRVQNHEYSAFGSVSFIFYVLNSWRSPEPFRGLVFAWDKQVDIHLRILSYWSQQSAKRLTHFFLSYFWIIWIYVENYEYLPLAVYRCRRLFLLKKQTGGNGIYFFHFFPFESELRMYTYERNIIALVISGRGWCVCVQYLNCFRSVWTFCYAFFPLFYTKPL